MLSAVTIPVAFKQDQSPRSLLWFTDIISFCLTLFSSAALSRQVVPEWWKREQAEVGTARRSRMSSSSSWDYPFLGTWEWHFSEWLVLLGKWSWQTASFCGTRSPRTSDLKKKITACHCLLARLFTDKSDLWHWPGAYFVNVIFGFFS